MPHFKKAVSDTIRPFRREYIAYVTALSSSASLVSPK